MAAQPAANMKPLAPWGYCDVEPATKIKAQALVAEMQRVRALASPSVTATTKARAMSALDEIIRLALAMKGELS